MPGGSDASLPTPNAKQAGGSGGPRRTGGGSAPSQPAYSDPKHNLENNHGSGTSYNQQSNEMGGGRRMHRGYPLQQPPLQRGARDYYNAGYMGRDPPLPHRGMPGAGQLPVPSDAFFGGSMNAPPPPRGAPMAPPKSNHKTAPDSRSPMAGGGGPVDEGGHAFRPRQPPPQSHPPAYYNNNGSNHMGYGPNPPPNQPGGGSYTPNPGGYNQPHGQSMGPPPPPPQQQQPPSQQPGGNQRPPPNMMLPRNDGRGMGMPQGGTGNSSAGPNTPMAGGYPPVNQGGNWGPPANPHNNMNRGGNLSYARQSPLPAGMPPHPIPASPSIAGNGNHPPGVPPHGGPGPYGPSHLDLPLPLQPISNPPSHSGYGPRDMYNGMPPPLPPGGEGRNQPQMMGGGNGVPPGGDNYGGYNPNYPPHSMSREGSTYHDPSQNMRSRYGDVRQPYMGCGAGNGNNNNNPPEYSYDGGAHGNGNGPMPSQPTRGLPPPPRHQNMGYLNDAHLTPQMHPTLPPPPVPGLMPGESNAMVPPYGPTGVPTPSIIPHHHHHHHGMPNANMQPTPSSPGQKGLPLSGYNHQYGPAPGGNWAGEVPGGFPSGQMPLPMQHAPQQQPPQGSHHPGTGQMPGGGYGPPGREPPYPTEQRQPHHLHGPSPHAVHPHPVPHGPFVAHGQNRASPVADVPFQRSTMNDFQNLDEFLSCRELMHHMSLNSFLENLRADKNYETDQVVVLAIDGDFFLRQLYSKLRQFSPLWFLHSAMTSEMTALIAYAVHRMRSLQVEPLFVFMGMGPCGGIEVRTTGEAELAQREHLWTSLTVNQEISNSQAMRDNIAIAYENSTLIDFVRQVQPRVILWMETTLKVRAVVAPFLQWPQMVSLLNCKAADALLGPTGALAVVPERTRLLTFIDFFGDYKTDSTIPAAASMMKVFYVDSIETMENLFPSAESYSWRQSCFFTLMIFTSSCYALLPVMPVLMPIDLEETHKIILGALDQQHRVVHECVAVVTLKEEERNHILRKYAIASAYFKHCPVFSLQTDWSKEALPPLRCFSQDNAESLLEKETPQNLSAVFGMLLPTELYHLQFMNAINSDVLTAIAQGDYVEFPPLSDTTLYRWALQAMANARLQLLSQLRELLRKYRPELPLQTLYNSYMWHMNESTELILAEGGIQLSNGWYLVDSPALECVETMKFSDIFLPILQRDENVCYSKPGLAFAACILRTLDFLGYVSHHDGSRENTPRIFLSDFGQVVQYSMNDTPQYQAEILLLVDLLRTTLLNSKPLQYCGPEVANIEQDTPPYILLASRIACILSIPFKQANFDTLLSNPNSANTDSEWARNRALYNRDLSSFFLIALQLDSHLHSVVRSLFGILYLNGHVDLPYGEYLQLAPHLPFGRLNNVIGGLLVRHMLQLQFSSSDFFRSGTPSSRVSQLATTFNGIPKFRETLENVLTFTVKALHLCLKFAGTKILVDDTEPPEDISDKFVAESCVMESLEAMEDCWTAVLPEKTFPENVLEDFEVIKEVA